MNPAVRSVQGNLIVLRPTEAQRQAELAEAVAVSMRAVRAQYQPEPEVDPYEKSWRLVLDLAAVAVLIAGVAVLMAGAPG